METYYNLYTINITMIPTIALNNYKLSATLPHNIIVYEYNTIEKIVTLNRFPIVQDITSISLSGVTISQPPKNIYYV